MTIRSRRARTLLAALAVLLPARARRLVHHRLLGYQIDPTARVGRAFLDVDRLQMGPAARIAGFTAIRGCEDVELGAEASIGPFVLVTGVRRGGRYFVGQDRHPALLLGRGASMSFLHFIDACDAITLGDFVDFGGAGSQILTHSVDLVRIRQSARPVTIGHHCMIGTRSVILAGTTLPECSVVSAGSVVAPESVRDGHWLYAGAPATAHRALNPRIPYFHHEQSDIQ